MKEIGGKGEKLLGHFLESRSERLQAVSFYIKYRTSSICLFPLFQVKVSKYFGKSKSVPEGTLLQRTFKFKWLENAAEEILITRSGIKNKFFLNKKS